MPDSRPRAVAVALIVVLASASGSADYVVEKGDTLGGIATRHGTTVSALSDLNSISNPNRIFIGQVLKLPGDTPKAITHVVVSGETLGSIAIRYGTTVAEIAAINGITNTNVIFVGTRLQIGGEPIAFAPEPAGSATYTVQAGDTLSRIAARFDSTIAGLVAANGIANPNLIRIGQILVVPASAWICPVAGATFFNDWGFPRSGGRFHQGNDLFGVAGTPVLAPVGGTVTFQTGSIGGLQFRLVGDDGATYLGSHMASFGAEGAVAAGAQIGTVGDSGNAIGSRPHLHFEIHPDDGAAVNPFPALETACR